jgi:hypothetical protein
MGLADNIVHEANARAQMAAQAARQAAAAAPGGVYRSGSGNYGNTVTPPPRPHAAVRGRNYRQDRGDSGGGTQGMPNKTIRSQKMPGDTKFRGGYGYRGISGQWDDLDDSDMPRSMSTNRLLTYLLGIPFGAGAATAAGVGLGVGAEHLTRNWGKNKDDDEDGPGGGTPPREFGEYYSHYPWAQGREFDVRAREMETHALTPPTNPLGKQGKDWRELKDYDNPANDPRLPENNPPPGTPPPQMNYQGSVQSVLDQMFGRTKGSAPRPITPRPAGANPAPPGSRQGFPWASLPGMRPGQMGGTQSRPTTPLGTTGARGQTPYGGHSRTNMAANPIWAVLTANMTPVEREAFLDNLDPRPPTGQDPAAHLPPFDDLLDHLRGRPHPGMADTDEPLDTYPGRNEPDSDGPLVDPFPPGEEDFAWMRGNPIQSLIRNVLMSQAGGGTRGAGSFGDFPMPSGLAKQFRDWQRGDEGGYRPAGTPQPQNWIPPHWDKGVPQAERPSVNMAGDPLRKFMAAMTGDDEWLNSLDGRRGWQQPSPTEIEKFLDQLDGRRQLGGGVLGVGDDIIDAGVEGYPGATGWTSRQVNTPRPGGANTAPLPDVADPWPEWRGDLADINEDAYEGARGDFGPPETPWGQWSDPVRRRGMPPGIDFGNINPMGRLPQASSKFVVPAINKTAAGVGSSAALLALLLSQMGGGQMPQLAPR